MAGTKNGVTVLIGGFGNAGGSDELIDGRIEQAPKS